MKKWIVKDKLNVYSEDGEFICSCSGNAEDMESMEANAKLIAEAPEMYQAIEKLLKAVPFYQLGESGIAAMDIIKKIKR